MEHHTKNVWLIRHAESIGNAGLATSQPDTITLTEKGVEQALRLADSFMRPPALIVTSPFIRTQQSAGPTIQRFPEARQEQWQVQEFSYLSPARYRDTTITDRKPFVEKYWSRCDPHYIDGEGAESFADFIRRVQQAIDGLWSCQSEFVAVFGHGLFMRGMIWRMLFGAQPVNASTMSSFRHFMAATSMPNTAIIKVDLLANLQEARISNVITTHLTTELITH
ncbi:MAG TPA: histidine phosphatase family protein [Blastocatellia bacterium]|nr:histidine phosphatase family protein [Blastocatellia bacterium]